MQIEIPQSVRLIGTVICELPVKVWPNCTLHAASIGAFSYVSPNCSFHRVTLGRYCSIGDGVMVLSSHPTNGLTTSPFPYQKLFASPFDAVPQLLFNNLSDTIIGNDVWIGSGVKLKSGIHIGDGAVIGAGSVVTKDVPSYTVIGGVPARKIRERFELSVRQRIESIAWWQYNLIGENLSWDNTQATLDSLEQRIQQGFIKPYLSDQYQVWQQDGKILAKKIDKL